jgi:mono/diheme cytochrome c family protein
MVHRGIALLLLLISPIYACNRKDYKTGEAVYQGECAKCHKLNGSGGSKGPELTDIFDKHDEQYIRDYTQDPRSIKPDSVMPPSKINDKQFEMLMDYLRKSARKHASLDPNHRDQR